MANFGLCGYWNWRRTGAHVSPSGFLEQLEALAASKWCSVARKDYEVFGQLRIRLAHVIVKGTIQGGRRLQTPYTPQ